MEFVFVVLADPHLGLSEGQKFSGVCFLKISFALYGIGHVSNIQYYVILVIFQIWAFENAHCQLESEKIRFGRVQLEGLALRCRLLAFIIEDRRLLTSINFLLYFFLFFLFCVFKFISATLQRDTESLCVVNICTILQDCKKLFHLYVLYFKLCILYRLL